MCEGGALSEIQFIGTRSLLLRLLLNNTKQRERVLSQAPQPPPTVMDHINRPEI